MVGGRRGCPWWFEEEVEGVLGIVYVVGLEVYAVYSMFGLRCVHGVSRVEIQVEIEKVKSELRVGEGFEVGVDSMRWMMD